MSRFLALTAISALVAIQLFLTTINGFSAIYVAGLVFTILVYINAFTD